MSKDKYPRCRHTLLQRLKSRHNYSSNRTYFLETVDWILFATGLTEGQLSHRLIGNPGHFKRWRTGDFDPSIDAKAKVLWLLSEELKKPSKRFAAFSDGFYYAAAILERDCQDPEGDVDTVEPTSGGSRE